MTLSRQNASLSHSTLLGAAVYLLDGYGVERADTALSGGWTVAAF